MKNKYLKSILVTMLMGTFNIMPTFSQATFADNAYFTNRFLGFNNTNGVNPLFFRTNSINRMRLNGNLNYTIDGYTGVKNGYLLLGNDALFSAQGAFSQLHLTGTNGTFIQGGGYRPWMQTGITLTDNQDLSYIGLRQVGTGFDVTETVIGWADNQSGSSGPDDFALRFFGEGGGNINISSDLQNISDVDGLHIARFTGTGEFGLGNTFGANAPGTPPNLYVRPASLGHYSLSNFRSVWQQFTNRNTANGTGTGETESDGLRIGIIGNSNTNVNGTAAIYNQETRALLFSTNANTTSINVTNGTTLERMRIMSVETPTHLSSGGFGTYNPGSIPANITRMAISHDPSQPVTRPLSLLHLGYNTGLNSSPLGSTDGWRSWMDIGTFTSNGTDNMYVGLKNEGTDRFDAVVSWGDNQSAGLSNEGPDNLRFIFTSTTSSVTNPGDPVSQSANGLEVARMHPGQASTLTNNYGMVGIGNFTSNAIDAKLDIDGDLRIRTVTQDNSLTRVLVIDPNDHNRVHYADIDLPAGGSGFVECSDTTGTTDLTGDSKLNLNNNNLYFENNGVLGKNHIGIGYDCSEVLPAKLSTVQSHPQAVNTNTTAVHTVNKDISNVAGLTYTGTYSEVNGTQDPFMRINHIGGHFKVSNATDNYAIIGDVLIPNNAALPLYSNNVVADLNVIGPGTNNIGIDIEAGNATFSNTGITITSYTDTQNGFNSVYNLGGVFSVRNAQNSNIGVSAIANDGLLAVGTNTRAGTTTQNGSCFGLYSRAGQFTSESFPASVAIGVYSNTAPTSGNLTGYAGFFDGNVWINGPANGTGFAATLSDGQFKTDVNDQTSADSILRLIQPKTFYFDTTNIYGLNFSSSLQHGMIAQEVEEILPELISNHTKPAMVDSLGNIVTPSVNYKTLNYEAFIPILIAGHQEQNKTIDSLKYQNAELLSAVDSLSIITENQQGEINSLNERLSHLESCLSGILPLLCQLSQRSIEQNDAEVQQQLRSIIDVELQNGTAIVLNQNVPNPFAESTVITFSIPETIADAQIVFHDSKGSLIKTVDIHERGNGQINVYANDLSAGAYTYSLIADGKIVATKRMVKQ